MQPALRRGLLTLVVIIAGAGTLSAQTPLETVAGIAELIGSFRGGREVVVGTTRLTVRRLSEKRPRARLHGFSVGPPAGDGWYIGYPWNTNADIVQAVWFVNQPLQRTAKAGSGGAMPSRPPVLAAKLQFYGEAADADFTAPCPGDEEAGMECGRRDGGRVRCTRPPIERDRLRRLRRQPHRSTRARPGPGTAVERHHRRPRVPAPDAPWLTVDVNATHRDTGGELRQAIDPAWDAFVRSVTLDAFQGPIVESVLLLGGAERPGPEADRVLIGGAVLGPAGVWVSHIPLPGAGLPVLSLSHIDDAFRRTEVEISVSGGAVRGVAAGDSVWVSGGSMAVRVDAASHTAAPRFELLCSPWELSHDFRQLTLTAGDYGVWLSCQTPGDGKREPITLPGNLRRLDPLTGATVGRSGDRTARPAREISGDAHLAWALEDVDTKTGREPVSSPRDRPRREPLASHNRARRLLLPPASRDR